MRIYIKELSMTIATIKLGIMKMIGLDLHFEYQVIFEFVVIIE